MGKLFGTDGIRGVANETLDAKLAYRVGQAAAISLADDSGTKPTVVIGKDTRISSDMLEGALVAGLTACGCNAILLGVIPTPAVAYLTVYLHADAGVVISASHNPYEHNGIKMFSSEGFKLSDALEASRTATSFSSTSTANFLPATPRKTPIKRPTAATSTVAAIIAPIFIPVPSLNQS